MAMKIIQSSNVRLGAQFSGQAPIISGQPALGDKLRVAIKNAFVRLIDLTIEEKADLLILAGDTFENLDISQNLLKFFINQIQRLEKIPALVLPGGRDPYQKGSFWEEWQVISPAENLFLLADTEKPYIEIPDLSAAIYGYPIQPETETENPARKIKRFGRSQLHVGVIYGNLIGQVSDEIHIHPFSREDLAVGGFDYIALGGQDGFFDFTSIGVSAAYSGSPEKLSFDSERSGQCLIVRIGDGAMEITPCQIGALSWKQSKISMETVASPEDLRQKIAELSGPDVILKVTLDGLALFESGLSVLQLYEEIKDSCLDLEFIDRTRVLPDISEVKVQEKTILGQYLKVMVEKLKTAEGDQRSGLEESLKTGYTLLTGKEVW
jgi:exonuclease SbcD